jgi:hypothetical protein
VQRVVVDAPFRHQRRQLGNRRRFHHVGPPFRHLWHVRRRLLFERHLWNERGRRNKRVRNDVVRNVRRGDRRSVDWRFDRHRLDRR